MKASAVLLAAILMATSVPLILTDGSDAEYEERTITVHLIPPEDTEEIQCRFYDDLPDIPYARFTDVFRILFESTPVETDNGDGTFTVTNVLGYTAVFDTVNDTITSDDFNSFKYFNLAWEEDENEEPSFPVESYRAEAVSDPRRTVMDLSSYGLDMRGEQEVWMPVSTASDLLCQSSMLYVVYTGESLYKCWFQELPDEMIEETYLPIYYSTGTRTADMISYSYGELCFKVDNLWGNVCRNDFTVLVSEVGLDAALETYSDGTRAVKGLLLNPYIENYSAGLTGLDRLVYDGGHTMFRIYARLYSQIFMTGADGIIEEKLSVLSLPEEVNIKQIGNAIREARTSMLGEGNYHVSGDTAIYTMNSFYASDGWERYYGEGGDYPDDDIGNFLRAVDTASADPDVRNFVIDLTTNEGGVIDVALYVLAAITGVEQKYINIDSHTGAKRIYYVRSDVNTDGVYDERDLNKRCDLNFGVLSSRYTYSCGNMFVNIAKELGVTVIGENPGGGCCSLSFATTPEGFPHPMSSTAMNTGSDFDYAAFERGADPDVRIEMTETGGVLDYTAYFDMVSISRIMDEQHPAEEDAPSETAVVLTVAITILAILLLLSGSGKKA